MTAENLQVRRATVEDVPRLVEMWQQEGLPWQELEKRFKEFQIVAGAGGEVVGALGLLIAGGEGCLHGEMFARPELGDAARALLWERTQSVARNHGLTRLWTQLDAPFWHGNGLRQATPADLEKLPPSFAQGGSPWLFLQLRAEAVAVSLDKEFALFKEAEQERTQKIFRQAKIMKMLAALIVISVFLLALVWAFLFFRVPRGGGH